jgi:hypothetical protein
MMEILVALLLTQAADAELAAALEKARAADRYAFKLESAHQGGESTRSTVVEGRFQKDRPVWLKSGDVEAYRKGEHLAVLKNGDWKRVEVREGDKRRRGLLAPELLRSVRLPHEELASILKQFKEIKKLDAKEGDQTVFLGDMTDEAAKAFLDANTTFDRRPEGAPGGTGRFWLSASGDLAMVEIIVRIKAKKGRDVGASTWITLSEIGTAKGEVPESAIKALEDK